MTINLDQFDQLHHIDPRTGRWTPVPPARLAAVARYTQPLTLSVNEVWRTYFGQDNPGWQTLNERDGTTWRDLTDVVECVDSVCMNSDCLVLTSTAWPGGYAHFPAEERLTVRIPACDNEPAPDAPLISSEPPMGTPARREALADLDRLTSQIGPLLGRLEATLREVDVKLQHWREACR